MTKVIPVILCGGSGTRLWPISRKNMPKQFAQLLGEESLFRAAITRASESWFHEPIIVTSDEQWIFVQQELSECGCTAEILVEPCGKNTAAAIFAAAYHAYKQHGDIELLVMPSDHYIS
jgi:mannose-1-phosphate guanylyltransferase/mannose-6-phosphate isomerase